MRGNKFSSPVVSMTLTAQCERCKDIFTVWAKIGDKQVRIELQSRIKLKGDEDNGNREFLILPRDGYGLYHHCGGRLHLYPDYRLA